MISDTNNDVMFTEDIINCLEYLQIFDNDYRKMMFSSQGMDPQLIEFKRAQSMKPDKIKEERNNLKSSIKLITKESTQIVIGITCKSGLIGIEVLRNWVEALQIPRGVLRAVDDVNNEIDYHSYDDLPVYIKYNSSESGNAYMKNYKGSFYGVLYQPKLIDNEFRQYGNFPLTLF